MSNPRYRPWPHKREEVQLAAQAIAILQDQMTITFDPYVLTKGKILHLRNAVTSAAKNDDEYYSGMIMDSRTYFVSLIFDFDEGMFFSECTCKADIDCEHGAALVHHLLDLSSDSEVSALASEKEAELKKIFGTQNADKFRELPIVAPLTLADTIHALSFINRYNNKNYFEIDFTDHNEILASAYLRDWQNYIDRDSKNSVTIKIEENKILIKCNNCKKRTERLCEHQQVVLGNHLVQEKILSLLNHELDYENIVEQAAQQLGLSKKVFLDNFGIRLDRGGITMVANSDDILINTANNPMLDAYLRQDAVKDDISDYFDHINHKGMMANAFAWSTRNSVFLLEGRLKKSGDSLASYISQVDNPYYWESEGRDISSNILEAFSTKNNRIIHEVLKKNIQPLSQLIHYFIIQEPHYRDKIKKKDLEPFKLSDIFAVLLINVEEESEFTNLEFSWQLGDDRIGIGQTAWNNDFFLGWNDQGFLIDVKESIEFLKATSFREKLRIPTRNKKLLKAVLDRAMHAGAVTFRDFETEELKGGVKQIHLREVGTFLVCEPSILYQEHRFPLLSDSAIVLSETGRRLIAEEEEVSRFRTEFKSMHPDWDKELWPQDFAYLPLSAVTDGSWFLDFINKSEEFQIEIFGQESLNTVRFNTNRPVINTGIKSGIDWFEANVEISFGGDLVAQKDWIDFRIRQLGEG